MRCRNHPDRDATAICQKLDSGFCAECCECPSAAACCGCLDPEVYCQFRTQCLIWEAARARRRGASREAGQSGTADPRRSRKELPR